MSLRVLAAGLVTAVVLIAGCGGQGHARRDAVEDFIHQANDAQTDANPAFTAANKAYVAFSKGKLPSAVARRDLARAEQSMRSMRDRIAAIRAPADARELKRRIVALFDADAALAHEATLLATFVPAAQSASQPLSGLGRGLGTGLKRAKTPAAQEKALRRYASGLEAVIGRMQRLHPPPLLLDRHHAQIEHLRSVRRLALQLVGALKAQNSKRVASLLLRFRRLSAQQTSAVDPSSLRAYNGRFRGVQQAEQAVQRERSRLKKVLP